jgi:hypothetical protein
MDGRLGTGVHLLLDQVGRLLTALAVMVSGLRKEQGYWPGLKALLAV